MLSKLFTIKKNVKMNVHLSSYIIIWLTIVNSISICIKVLPECSYVNYVEHNFCYFVFETNLRTYFVLYNFSFTYSY